MTHLHRPGLFPAAIGLAALLCLGAATPAIGLSTAPSASTMTAASDDQAAVDAAVAALSIANVDDVRGNLTLDSGTGDVPITWASSDASIVDTSGIVHRSDAETAVTLTATAARGSATASRVFAATVRAAVPAAPLEGYAFAYFTGNTVEGENIYFAASDGNDALDWTELNGGEPVLTSTQGTTGLRDPFVIRSPEGDTFYLIATDLSIGGGTSWDDSQRSGSKYIEVWESHDLKNWSAQRHVRVAPDTAGNTWAPEAYYDTSIGAYVVFWASKLYSADDPEHTGDTYQRMLYATTRDFRTFSEPQVWQDGASRIDSTVLEVDGTYHRFTKDEGAGTTGCTDIIQESSPELRATLPGWTLEDSCIGRDAGTGAVEGPTVFRSNPGDVNGDKFYLFVDEYGDRGYIPLETADIDAPTWTVSPSFDLPASPRHGTVVPVTAAELAGLKADEPAPIEANERGEILRYDFENGSGTSVADVSGNGRDGSIVGGASWQASGSLGLDGVDDYVDLPDDLLRGVEDVTVEADVWIDPDQSGSYFLYGLGNTRGGQGSGYLFATGDSAYRTSISTGNWSGEQNVRGTGPLPRGRWAHLAYTLEGTTARLYLDGAQVAEQTGVTVDPSDIGGGSTADNRIGRSNYDADRLLHGGIREFAIYNRALSADEIAAAATPPGVEVTVTSANPATEAGWYDQPVLVALDARSDGQRVQYRIDGGAWRTYRSALPVSRNGETTIDHRLLESNVVVPGSEGSTVIRVDRKAPTVAVTRTPGAGTGTPRNPITVEVTGTDTVSGLDRTEYRVDSGAWTAVSGAIEFGTVGDHVVSARSVDRAGNVSATRSTTVSIVADVPTTLTASARTVKAGSAITLTLRGFLRYDDVTVTIGGTPVQTVLTDRDGSARVTVRVPAGLPAGAASVTATGTDPAITATGSFIVR